MADVRRGRRHRWGPVTVTMIGVTKRGAPRAPRRSAECLEPARQGLCERRREGRVVWQVLGHPTGREPTSATEEVCHQETGALEFNGQRSGRASVCYENSASA